MPSFTSYLHKCQVKHRRWTLWVYIYTYIQDLRPVWTHHHWFTSSVQKLELDTISWIFTSKIDIFKLHEFHHSLQLQPWATRSKHFQRSGIVRRVQQHSAWQVKGRSKVVGQIRPDFIHGLEMTLHCGARCFLPPTKARGTERMPGFHWFARTVRWAVHAGDRERIVTSSRGIYLHLCQPWSCSYSISFHGYCGLSIS